MESNNEDLIYLENLEEARRLRKQLKLARVELECYHARREVGANDVATKDCRIAIDFMERDKMKAIEKLNRIRLKDWRIEDVPGMNGSLLRLKIGRE